MLAKIVSRLPGYADLRAVMGSAETRQMNAQQMATACIGELGRGIAVLDLGCGEGSSAEWFGRADSSLAWSGVDIEDSPEVAARRAQDPRMVSFDGVSLPFPDDSFDMIYCHQVLEHVQFPHELLKQVRRVLKPGGLFVGSVAYLEPYHSYSIFNFTPYGMLFSLRNADLNALELRHSSDGLYKIFRQMLGGFGFWSKFSSWSAIYFLIEAIGRLTRSDRRDMNLLKLQYAGSFCFKAKKMASRPG